MEDNNPELESFRRQWREEVFAKTKGKDITATSASIQPETGEDYKANGLGHSMAESLEEKWDNDEELAEDSHAGADFNIEGKRSGRTLRDEENAIGKCVSTVDPRSALEHYEAAVEKETQGSLGDSLNLYRKAYRLDSRVDQSYKDKHFPPSSFKVVNRNPSNAPVTVPNTAHHSLEDPTPSISDLLSDFSKFSISAVEVPTEGPKQPQCPIALLPSELLVEILLHTAIRDVATFARLSLVCKRLAYLVSTEERVWRRVCCGSEFGFYGMYYHWNCDLDGMPLSEDTDQELVSSNAGRAQHTSAPTSLDQDSLELSLLKTTYSSSWRQMFRTRPRVRFNGCYISTVNYIRPGASSPSQISWNTPVHIVTYYRYLRFFRDGTAVSLQTTAEPGEVVHHLSKDNMHTHHSAALPSAVMRQALRGRWRLSGPANSDSSGTAETEGSLFIETEGVDPKYMYKMHLSLRNAGRGAKNNKLTWRGFWYHNRLSDDWAEFELRNDRAFIWSRVKSYGMGS